MDAGVETFALIPSTQRPVDAGVVETFALIPSTQRPVDAGVVETFALIPTAQRPVDAGVVETFALIPTTQRPVDAGGGEGAVTQTPDHDAGSAGTAVLLAELHLQPSLPQHRRHLAAVVLHLVRSQSCRTLNSTPGVGHFSSDGLRIQWENGVCQPLWPSGKALGW